MLHLISYCKFKWYFKLIVEFAQKVDLFLTPIFLFYQKSQVFDAFSELGTLQKRRSTADRADFVKNARCSY